MYFVLNLICRHERISKSEICEKSSVFFTHNLTIADLQTMMFSFNTRHFVLLVAAACAATSAAEEIIDLGTACDFAILAKSGISTVPNSVITGKIGVSPIAATAMTGFSFTADASNTFSTSAQVVGQGHCMAASDAAPTPATLTQAVLDMEAAYTAGIDRAATYATNPVMVGDITGGNISGKTLYSGVYKYTAAITIDEDITLDAQDDPNAVFIITTTNQLVLAVGKKVILAGGAKAENIYWHVTGYISIGVGAQMKGNLLSATNILLSTGSSLIGRALAQTAVVLQMATVTKPTGCGEPVDDPLLASCSL
jgi:hypothetical protein